MDLSFLENISPAILWGVFGLVASIFELLFFSKFMLITIGISAFIVALCVQFNIIDSIIYQIILFIIISDIGIIFILKFLKYGRNNNLINKYQDMTGGEVTLINDLKKGEHGQAKWSGTIIIVQLSDNAENYYPKDSKLQIKKIEGNVFLIEPINIHKAYEIN